MKPGAIALIVVLTGALGVFVGRDAFPTTQTVAVASPSPSPSPSPVIRIQTHTVTQAETPPVCRKAIDLADSTIRKARTALRDSLSGLYVSTSGDISLFNRLFHEYDAQAARCYHS